MFKFFCHLTIVTTFLLFSISSSKGHPHMWIDLKTNIILNDEGHASSIQQEWLFGDFFSAALINDINKQNINLNDGLKKKYQK